MTKTPDWITISACCEEIVQGGMKRFDTDIDWVRLDQHKAAVAAAYEDAAQVLEERGSNGWAENVMAEYASVMAESIRARADTDAAEALERVKREARNEALRERIEALEAENAALREGVTVDGLAQVIRTVDGNNSLGAGELAERILSALTPAPVSVEDKVKAALAALPDGKWEVWTSNSFRRISRVGGGDGDVLCGTIQRSDGHPDLSWDEEQCQALCDLVNALRALAGGE